MIPHRLKVKKELIPLVTRKGFFVSNDYITLRFLLVPEQEEARFTVIVTKKVSKLAVDRHYNQRKIYNIIQELIPHSVPGYSTLIFPKKDLRLIEQDLIKEETIKILKKTGLIS
ncbi:MAG: ribonuclease P protein component [bacterium]